MAILNIPVYIFASIAVGIGGFLNGHDTGAIGGLVAMKQFEDTVGKLSPTLLGFTVSLIMLTGAIPAVWAGWLADRFGRLKVIMIGGILFVIGAILQGSAFELKEFLVGRAVSGLGEGVYISTVNVYICEIVPVKHRGIMSGMFQLMATAGVCAGYFTCYGTVHIKSSMAWRMPYVIQTILGLVFVGSTFVLPDSPRWLLLHGRQVEAITALERLDFVEAEEQQAMLGQMEQRPSLSAWQGFLLLWKKAYRKRTILGLFVLGMVQLSGIDGVLYYAPTLFKQAGLSGNTASFLASGLSAILMLAISIPAFLLSDKWGRRTSIISGGVILSGCMLMIGSLYAAGAVHSYGIGRWVVVVSVFIFGLSFSATWGIVGKVYASEIQPNHTRAAANSVATGLGFFTNWLVAMLTPILLSKSAFGAYFLFGFLALGTVLVLGVHMPETRLKSLESIQDAFSRPTASSWNHHLKKLATRLGLGNGTASSHGSYELEEFPDEAASTTTGRSDAHGVRPALA